MRRRAALVTILALVMAAAMVTAVSAGKPTCEDDPTRPWCDTEPPAAEPEYWTCEARNDNGAMWQIGTYDSVDGVYQGDSFPVCIDILEAHRNVENWTVTWSGTTTKGTTKGFKLVFEEEVHANVFAETVVTSVTSGTEPWDAVLDFGGEPAGNMVFVAMPHSGDRWTSFSITVTPTVP